MFVCHCAPKVTAYSTTDPFSMCLYFSPLFLVPMQEVMRKVTRQKVSVRRSIGVDRLVASSTFTQGD